MRLNHESYRLAALRQYDVLDSPSEKKFDLITTSTARLLNVLIACITLVDEKRFFFKSSFGTDARNMTRREGFCDTTIRGRGVHCIENTLAEPSLRAHPLVCDSPHIKSYAGAPLVTSDGFAIGTLCVMDSEPREYSDTEKSTLKELSEFVMFQLDQRRLSAEKEKMEEKRRDVQKLESLGLLAGGIAHDFNNLLVGVLGNASLAARQLDVRSPAQTAISDIVHAAEQATELTDQLLAYAGQRPTSPIPLNMTDLLNNMGPLLRSSVATNSRIDIRYDENLPFVVGDPTQIRQVIFNLVTNASDAYCDKPGSIRIRISSRSMDDSTLATTGLKASTYVQIEVEDSGCGMDAGTLGSMFSPFFTTKLDGRGLGMSIVQRIVRGHGGDIEVESNTGRGCKVAVFLPAEAARKTREKDPLPRVDTNVTGHGTVIVVDDEELVVRMTTSAVKSFGYKVCSALNGEDALEYLESDDDFDAVILDATMPGMNGWSTLDAIRKQRPDLPTVITSGHHIDEVATQFKDFEKLTFLHKPWTLEQLSQALQNAMPS